jgi:hypothetical protein
MGGRMPSVALWDVNGVNMASDEQHETEIDQGSFHEMSVITTTKEPPSYAAIVAQKTEAICVSGIQLQWEGTRTTNLLTGDVGAACDMPWYQSKVQIYDTGKTPKCMWMDGSGKNRTIRGYEYPQDEHGGDQRDPPGGISFSIEDWTGTGINENVTKQRTDNRDLMCKHPARFKVYWDDSLLKWNFRIPVYEHGPIKKRADMTDLDNFLDLPVTYSDGVSKAIIEKREEELSDEEFLEKRSKHLEWLHGTLNMDEASAQELCMSKTSYGPDWYSHTERMFCDMTTKTLLRRCQHDEDSDCFDPQLYTVRHRRCESGALCSRFAHVEKKEYKWVDDNRVGRH